MKIVRILFSVLLLLFTSQKHVSALENYLVSANLEYKILEDGNTAVTHTVTVKNTSSAQFVKNYILNIANTTPKNIKAYENGETVPYQLTNNNGVYSIKLNFTQLSVGKNESKTFIVTYEDSGLTVHTGQVWEISIPQITADYDDYRVTLSVPFSFGEEAFISPKSRQKSQDDKRSYYNYRGSDLHKSGIKAVFGKYQVYSIKLIYHLENRESKIKTADISIPPDTSTQRVYYTQITPAPQNIHSDDDGNWLASFELQPKSEIKTELLGYVQVFASPVKLLTPYPSTLLANLKPRKYWESNDAEIIQIAEKLRTPENIYKFVVDTLDYNYDRVKPDAERLGAKKSLSFPSQATCAEFTDLFIALSRANAIPAREINGYGYSDNPDLQPLSYISDILHSWPEYWDRGKQMWIPVDPTWESASKIDYFNSFDLRHIAFAIHGLDSTLPLPAGSFKSDYLTKDIFISFSTLPEEKDDPLEIGYRIEKGLNPFTRKLVITIKNTKTSAIYNLAPEIKYSGNEIASDNIPVLPPYASYSIKTDIPLGIFALKIPDEISVSAEDVQKDIAINKTPYVAGQLLFFLSILLTVVLYITFRSKKVLLILKKCLKK